jgi:uncharacterized lipoprotein YddW (UPF0748 family)
MTRIVFLCLILLVSVTVAQTRDERPRPATNHRRGAVTREAIPPLRREFRAVWVATVANIDWPSKRTLTTDEQKTELTKLLDKAQELNLNAIILQVRPQCDALYQSLLEPWAEYLTGQQGIAPSPFYDPLEFAVAEAHKRGLELHAWFNPYRASHPSATKPPAASHISVRRPDLAKQYGRYIWLDPGEAEVQTYVLSVILDVVQRYDIDGVHFDDYFYPYIERDANNNVIPFPDDVSWGKYQAAGGTLSRADWRRKNVNDVIQRLAQEVHLVKPHVKFGISPFGIWQPGNPPGIVGLNAYQEIYADSRKWLSEGWVDYLSPQLYWPIAPPAQSYTALLDWWSAQNTKGRHLWPGNATYKISTPTSTFPATELVNQIEATRARTGSTGNVHFSMNHLLSNREGISDLLKTGVYAEPALLPATSWIDDRPPAAPSVFTFVRTQTQETVVNWTARGDEAAFLWVVQVKESGVWKARVLPSTAANYVASRNVTLVAVSAVDRAGNQSALTIVRLGN